MNGQNNGFGGGFGGGFGNAQTQQGGGNAQPQQGFGNQQQQGGGFGGGFGGPPQYGNGSESAPVDLSYDWGGVELGDGEDLLKKASGKGDFVPYSYPDGTVCRARLESIELRPPSEYVKNPHYKVRFIVVQCSTVAGHNVFGTLDPVRLKDGQPNPKKAAIDMAKLALMFEIAGAGKIFKAAQMQKRLPNADEIANLVGTEYIITLGAVDDRDTGAAGRNYFKGVATNGTITQNPPRRVVVENNNGQSAPSGFGNSFAQQQGGGFGGGFGGAQPGPNGFDPNGIPF